MANDTVTLNSGSGGIKLACDKNGSDEYYQRVKLIDGTDDSDTVIHSGAGTAANALRVELPTNGTGVVGLNAGTAAIGSVSLTSGTTLAGSVCKAEDAAHASGDTGIFILSRRVDTAPTTSSGTDADYSALNTDGNGCLWTAPYGNVAHDAVDAGNPIKFGAKAKETDNTDPGSVAEDDRTDLYADRNGRLLVNGRHPNAWSASSNLSTAATTVLKAAPGASLSFYLCSVSISSLTAQSTKIVSDSAGSPADEVELIYTGANGNANLVFPEPIRFPANVNIAYITSAAVATSVTVTGYTAP